MAAGNGDMRWRTGLSSRFVFFTLLMESGSNHTLRLSDAELNRCVHLDVLLATGCGPAPDLQLPLGGSQELEPSVRPSRKCASGHLLPPTWSVITDSSLLKVPSSSTVQPISKHSAALHCIACADIGCKRGTWRDECQLRPVLASGVRLRPPSSQGTKAVEQSCLGTLLRRVQP